ncbi:calmodulin-4-like [Haliotis rufescens]|uniref:calmodulin-4-like n=1 Tax=Haliotis rufescens TaxID=6454 RepID=UPI00201F091F|nr:calmodulin-4-like [Haliotis rufescens]
MSEQGSSASCRLYDHEVAMYTGFFKKADANSDDCLSFRELEALCQQLGFKLSRKEVKKLFRALDEDGNKVISLEEFLNKMPNISTGQRNCAHLRQIFQTVDKNGDGYLTTDELYDVIMSSGRPFRMSMVKGVVEKLDKSGDGRLNFEEFLNMIDLA